MKFILSLLIICFFVTSCGPMSSCDGVDRPKSTDKVQSISVKNMNFDQLDIGLNNYSLLAEDSSSQSVNEIYTPIQAYRFSMVIEASLETLNVQKSNFKWSEFFISSAYACSFGPPLLINDIESITISIASTSNETYQIGQDVTNEFMVLGSRKNTVSKLTLTQWNKKKEYGARQNYRDSIKLVALAFADPKSIAEGSYKFALEVILNDNTSFSLESAPVLIDPYDNGQSTVKYLDVYKERDSLLCSENEDVNETLNSGEIALLTSNGIADGSYLSEFILETFTIEPVLNSRCAVLSEPVPESYCGSTSEQVVVHTIPEQYALTAQSIGYRSTSEIAGNYTEGPCLTLEQDSE